MDVYLQPTLLAPAESGGRRAADPALSGVLARVARQAPSRKQHFIREEWSVPGETDTGANA